MIVVLCGKKRSGKSESVEFVINEQMGFSPFALGDHVKETLEAAAKDNPCKMLRVSLIGNKSLRDGDRDGKFIVVSNEDVRDLFLKAIEILENKGIIKKRDVLVRGEVEKRYNAINKVWDNQELWTPRRLMQTFATDIVCLAIDDSVFVRMTMDRVLKTPDVENVLISDCRQPHEYKYLRTLGAKFIFIERDTGMIDNHYSEQGIMPQEGDAVINNNGTLAELRENVLKSINEIKK